VFCSTTLGITGIWGTGEILVDYGKRKTMSSISISQPWTENIYES
jgi:hypothetical protein